MYTALGVVVTLASLLVPSADSGCWELVGSYDGATLRIQVSVTPSLEAPEATAFGLRRMIIDLCDKLPPQIITPAPIPRVPGLETTVFTVVEPISLPTATYWYELVTYDDSGAEISSDSICEFNEDLICLPPPQWYYSPSGGEFLGVGVVTKDSQGRFHLEPCGPSCFTEWGDDLEYSSDLLSSLAGSHLPVRLWGHIEPPCDYPGYAIVSHYELGGCSVAVESYSWGALKRRF